MIAFFWKKIESRSLPNLRVLTLNGVEVGFIRKLKTVLRGVGGTHHYSYDSGGDVNAWRAFQGIGDNAKFLGHSYRTRLAQEMVEAAAVA